MGIFRIINIKHGMKSPVQNFFLSFVVCKVATRLGSRLFEDTVSVVIVLLRLIWKILILQRF
jgi:hypothetical protein